MEQIPEKHRQRMILIYNALLDGWKVKLINKQLDIRKSKKDINGNFYSEQFETKLEKKFNDINYLLKHLDIMKEK